MGAEKPLNRLVVVVVGADADFVFTSHRRPVRHAERCGNSRDHPAIVVFSWTSCANHRIDIVDELLTSCTSHREQVECQTQRDESGDEGRSIETHEQWTCCTQYLQDRS